MKTLKDMFLDSYPLKRAGGYKGERKKEYEQADKKETDGEERIQYLQ